MWTKVCNNKQLLQLLHAIYSTADSSAVCNKVCNNKQLLQLLHAIYSTADSSAVCNKVCNNKQLLQLLHAIYSTADSSAVRISGFPYSDVIEWHCERRALDPDFSTPLHEGRGLRDL